MDETRVGDGDGRDIRFLLLPRKRRGGEASFRARGLPVDETINGRDTGLFWIGNFEISRCLCVSCERWKRPSEEVMNAGF